MFNFKKFKNRKAVSMMEYALMGSAVSIAAIGAALYTGNSAQSVYCSVQSGLPSKTTSVSSYQANPCPYIAASNSLNQSLKDQYGTDFHIPPNPSSSDLLSACQSILSSPVPAGGGLVDYYTNATVSSPLECQNTLLYNMLDDKISGSNGTSTQGAVPVQAVSDILAQGGYSAQDLQADEDKLHSLTGSNTDFSSWSSDAQNLSNEIYDKIRSASIAYIQNQYPTQGGSSDAYLLSYGLTLSSVGSVGLKYPTGQ